MSVAIYARKSTNQDPLLAIRRPASINWGGEQ
jgi:hypothetical protein